jgi:hypothetical protein
MHVHTTYNMHVLAEVFASDRLGQDVSRILLPWNVERAHDGERLELL